MPKLTKAEKRAIKQANKLKLKAKKVAQEELQEELLEKGRIEREEQCACLAACCDCPTYDDNGFAFEETDDPVCQHGCTKTCCTCKSGKCQNAVTAANYFDGEYYCDSCWENVPKCEGCDVPIEWSGHCDTCGYDHDHTDDLYGCALCGF